MKLIAKVLSGAVLLLPFSAFAVYDVGTDVNANVNTSVGTTKADTSVQINAEADVKDDVDVDDTSGTVHATSEITGDPDFDLMVKTVKSEHSNVHAVDLDADGNVDVAYVHHGWLFGFIPLNVTSHTVVMASSSGDADVKFKLPWWSMFVSGLSKVKADAQTSLSTDATIQSNANVSANATAKAQLVAKIVQWLDAAAAADASASAGTK